MTDEIATDREHVAALRAALEAFNAVRQRATAAGLTVRLRCQGELGVPHLHVERQYHLPLEAATTYEATTSSITVANFVGPAWPAAMAPPHPLDAPRGSG